MTILGLTGIIIAVTISLSGLSDYAKRQNEIINRNK